MLLRLLVLIVRDSVMTLYAVAHNVNNDMDEVLLVIVCTMHNWSIFNRSRFILNESSLNSVFTFMCGKDKLNRILKVSILFPYLLLNAVFFPVRNNQC